MLWQGFVVKDVVHRPKPLAQPFSIRAAKPWCVVSQRAGQQLYRTSCDLNGRRSHVGPPVFRSRFLVDVLALNREPNGSEGERFGFAKSNRNCGQHRAGMWAERGCEPYSTPTQVTLRRTTSSIPMRLGSGLALTQVKKSSAKLKPRRFGLFITGQRQRLGFAHRKQGRWRKCPLPNGDGMQVVSGLDWSVGLNSRSSNSLTDTVLLSRIGSDLRGLYQDLLDEPLPEFLAVFVRELEECEQDAQRPADHRA